MTNPQGLPEQLVPFMDANRGVHRGPAPVGTEAETEPDATRVCAIRGGRVLMSDAGPYLPPELADRGRANRRFLGRSPDGLVYWSSEVDVEAASEARTDWIEVQQLIGRINPADGAVVMRADALGAWNDSHRHCGRCGNPTEERQHGAMRYCGACQVEHFPRVDPAVMMLVIDEAGEALLARRPGAAYWTVIAGYVDHAESAEDAARREIEEEVGLEAIDLQYVGSQPWSPSGSLMLGFVAKASSKETAVAKEELEEARWWSPAEFEERLRMDKAGLPPRGSMARWLIKGWILGRFRNMRPRIG
jgi:NAD+ diphosphatase